MNLKLEKYIGKWCIYRHSYEHSYTKIFIHDAKNGLVKYSSDGNIDNSNICDADEFNPCIFKESPFSEKPVERRTENVEKDNYWICSNHDWSYMDFLSYPPIHSRKCRLCGKTEHEENSKWVDGEY